ncbi:MAG: hypothetical protein ABSF45_03600 [Terriglobia bacterium]
MDRHGEQFSKNSEKLATVADLVGRLEQAQIRLAVQTRGNEARTGEQMQGREARLGSLETKMTQFLERMDRFIQGLEGNGHKPQ